MTPGTAGDPDDGARSVLVPAGRPLHEAAAWVGAACWAELALQQLLTSWLAPERSGGGVVGVEPADLWSIRSHRAASAEVWHRRLPELRELPRAGFVAPAEPWAALLGAGSAAATAGPAQRGGVLQGVLAGMLHAYEAHRSVAAGPADGPTADALTQVIALVVTDLSRLGR